MRLITVDTESGTRAAVQVGEAFALVPGPFEDVGALLRAGEAGLEAARRAHDAAANGGTALNGTVLRRPVLNPEAVICVGLNYRTHIEEMGREVPTAPTLFTKLARALTDPYSDIPIPAVTQKMDYEGELAVVIGKRGRFITREQAWDHVAGVSVLNDVTARDHQNRTIQWWAGKSFEATTPMGPARRHARRGRGRRRPRAPAHGERRGTAADAARRPRLRRAGPDRGHLADRLAGAGRRDLHRLSGRRRDGVRDVPGRRRRGRGDDRSHRLDPQRVQGAGLDDRRSVRLRQRDPLLRHVRGEPPRRPP